MKQLDENRLKINAWKLKLSSVRSERNALRNELFAILNQENKLSSSIMSEFERRKNVLLSNNHEQGFYWAPHFNWLFSFLSWFSPRFRETLSGSRLRQTLESGIEAIELTPLTRDKQPHLIGDYDEVIENPTNQMLEINARQEDLDARFKDLDNLDHAGRLDLLDRLYALKPTLRFDAYQQYLDELYSKFPQETTLYFYDKYQKDSPEDISNTHDFVEIHMLAQSLMAHFVTHSDNVYIHRHNIIYLLIFLSPQKNDAPLNYIKEVITQWSENALFDLYTLIEEKLSEEERSKFREHNKLTQDVDSDNHSSLPILINRLENSRNNPLRALFARLAAEQLYIDHKQYPQEDGSYSHALIELITNKILFSSYDEKSIWERWKDIKGYQPNIPAGIFDAERYAIQLISASDGDALRQELRQLRTHPANKSSIQPESVNWVIARVSPKEKDLSAKISHHLLEKNVYDLTAYKEYIEPFDIENNSVEALLNIIQTNLERANSNSINAEGENKIIKDALIAFNTCLKQPDLTQDDLETLLGLFKEFKKEYIAPELATHLNKQLFSRHAQLLQLNQPFEAKIKFEIDPKTDLAYFIYELEKCTYDSFEAQRKDAMRAVECFVKYLEIAPATDFQEKANYLETLGPYLSETQYTQWKDLIKPPVSEQSFFKSKRIPTDSGPSSTYSLLS